MEKLIDLLNEYEIEREEKINSFNDKEKPLWEWYKDCTGDLTFEPTDNNKMNWEYFSWDTAHSVIISKSYWFIQWLVQKDKINIEEIENSEYYLIDWMYYYERKKFWIELKEDLEEILLMLLAISENPIEFLFTILR